MCKSILFIFLFFTSPLMAESIVDEYSATGGLGIGFNNTGVAYQDDLSAIRINPALLAQKKQYSFSGSYHWPVSGNEFYHAGVIDSKTSPVATGLSYTGYLDDTDNLIKRRIHLGLAQSMGKMKAGISGQFLETNKTTDKKIRSITLGIGLLTPITPNLNLGGSIENMANNKIKDIAPRTYRAGLSYKLSRTIHANLDYQNRRKFTSEITESGDKKEQMIFASLVGFWKQYLKLFASYGRQISSKDKHSALAGGAGIQNKNLSLTYMVAMPNLDVEKEKHHAVNLSLNLKL